MKLLSLEDVQARPRRVAVGTFDGVHLGHRRVIDGSDTVLTFDPHPVAVVAPHAAPRLLTTLERKARLIAEQGVEELVVIHFDQEFAAQSAQHFVDDILVGCLDAQRVAVGENFRFGHKAEGDTELLRADGRFEVVVEPLLEFDGEVVSSSHIRGLVLGGAVEYAGRLLGAPFAVSGEVVHGDKRGRELGFPTANLIPPDGYLTPGHGVYAARVTPEGEGPVAAAVNVGVRPQFQTGRGELIEAYLVDWEGDLYGRRIEVEFLKRLRGERRFPSVEALVEQMASDVEDVRRLQA
ncbi:MAG: bifunctional riboflavin kinase/FAD synthetase [Solirubrobacteraceae bacterium]|nr:bifunctional riboflavin kinase/FAD synthetase [Solirubrobacteraceae bacterium]